MPPSDFALPNVPPKDTNTNTIFNPPMDGSRPPSIDIASLEPPPPRSFGRHRRQVSSWMPSPLDPDTKARAMAAAPVRTPPPSEVPSVPLESTEVFEEIPIGRATPLEPETPPKFSLNDYISRLSFGTPQWAKKLRPTKRGVELPFPVNATRTKPVQRYPVRVNQPPERLDAPASPTSFRE